MTRVGEGDEVFSFELSVPLRASPGVGYSASLMVARDAGDGIEVVSPRLAPEFSSIGEFRLKMALEGVDLSDFEVRESWSSATHRHFKFWRKSMHFKTEGGPGGG